MTTFAGYLAQHATLAAVAHGALTGFLAAAAVDYQAFKAWKSFDEFTTYNWRVAATRWVQGAVIGAITAVGLFS